LDEHANCRFLHFADSESERWLPDSACPQTSRVTVGIGRVDRSDKTRHMTRGDGGGVIQ
jgi:hypothetical protein